MLAKGLVTDFKKSGYGALGSLFMNALRGKVEPVIAHGTARAIMQFTSWATSRSEADPWALITDEGRLIDYVDALRPVLRPATIRNHVAAIQRFMKAIGVFPELSVHVPPTVRPRLESATKCIRDLWNKTNRWRAAFQKRRVLAGGFTPVNLLAIRSYITDRGWLGRASDDLTYLENYGIEQNGKRWNAVVAFMVAQVSEQGHRLCELQAFRAREFNTARAVSGYMLIRIEEHKTEGCYGDAVIVLRNFEFELWTRFAQLRAKHFPGKAHFLLRSDGTQITCKILDPLNVWLSKRRERKANHTDLRKSVTGIDRQFNNKRGEKSAASAADAFMNHSRRVADDNYYYRTDRARLAEWLSTLDSLEQSYLIELARKPGVLPQTPLASFPSKERVFARLEPDRVSLGLIATEIKSHAWLLMRQEWRSKRFSALIAALEVRAKNVKPSGFPVIAVKSLINNLDAVWSGEANNIANCLYQRILK